MVPFWGSITSSIDWCEPNYEINRFIAEPLNTISNLSFVLFGLIGAIHELQQYSKASYVILHGTISCIGIGSMLFHGTLTMLGQQLDELPMVWVLLIAIYCVNRDSIGTDPSIKRLAAVLLLAYACMFSILHVSLKTTTAFQVHFGVLLGLCLFRMFARFRKVQPGENGTQIVKLFFFSGIVAFYCWLLDYHGCEFLRKLPIHHSLVGFGHSLWHLLMGYSAFCLIVMLKIYEFAEAGKMLDIKYWPFTSFGLPFTYRIKRNISDMESSNNNFDLF